MTITNFMNMLYINYILSAILKKKYLRGIDICVLVDSLCIFTSGVLCNNFNRNFLYCNSLMSRGLAGNSVLIRQDETVT